MPWLRQMSRCDAMCLLAALIALCTPAQAGQYEAQTTAGSRTAEQIHARVWAMAEAQTMVPVFLVLTEQPHKAILERVRAVSTLKNQAAEARYRLSLQSETASSEEVRQARAGLDAITLELRQEAFREIEAEISPQQAAVESRLRGLGATRIGRYLGINMLTAEIPSAALAQLEADPAIARVWPVEMLRAQIVNSVPAIGAPTFWANGYTGQGESVAVLDTGVKTNHPAFLGKNIVSQVFLNYGQANLCFADNSASPQDQQGHGTFVAGIVASQGSIEGKVDWTHYQGVAKGIDTLYNHKVAFQSLQTSACTGTEPQAGAMADLRDVAAGLDWMVTHTSSSIANFSFGHAENLDDDADAQLFDYYADAYDLSVAVAAGNAGSGSLRLTSPAIAYNVVSVGNWDTGGWPDNSHEVMNSTSSAGPTSNNRQKPDIAAPGTNIYSAAYNWDLNQGKNPDYVQATGTSVSAPHIAGALALLRDIAPAGQPVAPMVKALLLNTADTPGSAGGWLSGPGWGYVNLRTAWSQRSLLDLAELGGSSGAPKIRLYQVPLEGNQFRATAVWNRHVYEPSVDSTGNPTFSSWAVSGLAMGLYDPATANPIPGAGILFAQGNVEQLDVDLTAPHLANAILSVAWQSGSTSSAAPEPIALAFSSPFTPVTGPAFAVSCSAPPVVYLGAPFTVTCNVTNTGDFPALTVNGYIANASGMAGAVDLQFGNLQAGQTSSPGFAYMTAPLVAGDYPATIGAATDSWGGSFVGDTTVTVHVAPNPDWAPWLSCAGPSPIPTGSADVRLSVTGNSFIPGATVLWDGNALATTFIDNTSLTAIVPAAMLVTATTGGVSVANPSGTVSVTRSLTVPPPAPRTAGYIYTIAGNGSGCFADPTMGDGNPATSAQFNFPTAIAADRAGNIYVADPNDQRVRRIGQNGTITTFAGNRQFGYSGDGGLATAATFKGPGRMAADVAGNVYIVDSGNYIIRRVDAQGIISTYAGNGNSGYGGDGGPATSASLGNVGSLALDGAGNLYVADTANNRIRQVTPQGIISTCAGNGQPGYSGDSGKTTDAKLNAPTGVAADAAGNLFIADTGNNVIRKVTAGGVISTYAGGGTDPYTSGDGGPAVGAYMPQPVSVALDGQGNLFILDHGELRVRKVDTGGIISTYAGVIAGSGPLVEDVPATSAFLYGAQDIAVDAAGNLYVVQAATGLQTGSGVARVVPAAGAGSSLPFVTSLDPPLATAGGDALILTVSGENFAADSRVNWDEGTLRTTYLNPTTLSAAVPADVLAVTGTHTIVVQSSTPGATLSNTLLFFVQPFPSGLPTIVASPNPVPVPYYPDGGATTLTWNAPGHNHVAINSDIGLHLVSSGGPSGSVRTPSDTGYPQTFFLTDTDTNQMLASVTVNMLIVSNKIGVPEQPNRVRNPKAEAVTGGQQPTGAYR